MAGFHLAFSTIKFRGTHRAPLNLIGVSVDLYLTPYRLRGCLRSLICYIQAPVGPPILGDF
ncbi:hypothetical protein LYNGBM3L_41100 [Moorena producens 3L]|uniref:Uncharacterized protein n=1 Tax=Moorena producens 3L TaxID=489825 RepID=F4XVV2_9CYAN|nr:hypothetical protein LYNGBM3L_41100 [Moorena producens 3L]